jgi:hypothetical protein
VSPRDGPLPRGGECVLERCRGGSRWSSGECRATVAVA